MENKNPGSTPYFQNSTGSSSYYYSTPNCTVPQYFFDYNWPPQQYPIYNPPAYKSPVLVSQLTVRNPISKMPEAFITVGKSRTKMFNNKCYIKDNTDFEIELFNPSSETLGVKFKVNGQYISDSHFVLRPGKHFFLDRYINENRKFKYTTYTIEDNKEALDAIAMNGSISVEFYREYNSPLPEPVYFNNTFGTPNTAQYDASTSNVFYCNMSGDTFGDTSGITTNNVIRTTTDSNGTSNGIMQGTSLYNSSLSNVVLDEIETGMVAKGAASDTEFDTVDITFELAVLATREFKILPHSQKPIEAKDLVSRCVSCDTKLKKHSKFCHGCGTQI